MNPAPPHTRPKLAVLVGTPNVGKTTLLNRLTGARGQVGNFPGTTTAARVAELPPTSDGRPPVRLVDLPGLYDLDADDELGRAVRDMLDGRRALPPHTSDPQPPDLVILVLETAGLDRGLALAGAILRRHATAIVVLTMADEARTRRVTVDIATLRALLGCPVIATAARVGEGVDELRRAIDAIIDAPPARQGADGIPEEAAALREWARRTAGAVTHDGAGDQLGDRAADAVDHVVTHPVGGPIVFAGLMTLLFWAIFQLATYPMDWIDLAFSRLAGLAERVLPPGAIADLIANGAIAGVGATVIFLPQIVILFFLIALLEESGYLARAALVTDRALRRFGLSGQAFVPLLSAHACALPAITATRGILEPRVRLAAILAAPFMSCSARIPVYVLLVGLLFPASPLLQSVAFVGAYLLGIGAGVLSSLVARRTILRGPAQPFLMELPPYRLPRLGPAVRIAAGRGLDFLRKAGTLILAVSIMLWWLGAYPTSGPSPEGESLRRQAETEPSAAEALLAEADRADARHAQARSALGRLGDAVAPVFAPLGYDAQLTVGVLASFAAREVFVPTMAVQITGEEDDDPDSIRGTIAEARRSDGSPVFTPAVTWSLLVYFVLAMQCLPTVVLTAREAGHWKWGAIQFGWMCGVAWVAAAGVFQLLAALGLNA